MEFFDRKEEVMDIQLTQYGKHLLSRGKFRPVFYAFYDDDVIYDLKYANNGDEEIQKLAEDRIKSTPRIKSQYVFSGRELKANKVDSGTCKGEMAVCNKLQVSKVKQYALGLPLGTSEPNTSKHPAWAVKFLKGSLSGSSYYSESTREEVEFTFLSDASTDYQNTSTNLGKYIDIYDNAGRQIRFYFHGGLGGATDNPPPTPAGGEVRAVYAATDKETIAENFRSMVSGTKEGGNDCDGCLDNSVLVFDTFISGNKTTVLNKKQGPMKDAVISSGLSDYITLARKVQGKIQSPRPLPIPQLDITLKTKVKVASVYEPPSGEELPTSFSYELPIYKDGTRLQFESEQLILDITENNAPFLRENMEVEVFKVEEDENGVEELMPLMFEKGVDFIVDNILLDGREIANKLEANRLGIEEGPHMVNYFLDLAVDKEIDIDVEQIRNYEINVNPYLRDRNEEEPCDDDAANNNNTGVY